MSRLYKKHTNGFPSVKPLAILGCAVLLLGGFHASAEDKPPRLTLLSGPELSGRHHVTAKRLSDELEKNFHITTKTTIGSDNSIKAVLSDPNTIALVQRDRFDLFMAQDELAEKKLEFYGSVPSCLFVAVRDASPWMLPSHELGGITPSAIDVGPIEGNTYTSLASILTSSPVLANATMDYRGGARALSMLRVGKIDAYLFIDRPSFYSPKISQIFEDEQLALTTNILGFFKGASDGQLNGFVPTEIELVSDLPWKKNFTMTTLCTTSGLLVNNDLGYDILDKIILPVSEGALDEETIISMSKITFAYDYVRSLIQGLWDFIVGIFNYMTMPGSNMPRNEAV